MLGNDTEWQQVLNQEAQGLANLASLHSNLLSQQNLIATGTGGNPQAASPTIQLRPPWLDAPQGSEPFDFQNSVNLPGVGVGTTVLSFTVPDGMDGVINAISCNFGGGGFTQGSGDIQFQILRNGAAIKNYDNILNEKGTTQIPRNVAGIRIFANQTITMIVNHVANLQLNGQITGSLLGYFYPNAG